jgi:hypothetical protein
MATDELENEILSCQESFEVWADGQDLCLDQIFMSTDGVPENPYEDFDTAQAYTVWCAAWQSGRAVQPPVRELLCQRCDQNYPVWFAPNELWNRVCPDSEGIHFLCLTCFAVLAEGKGIVPTAWVITLEDSGVETALENAPDKATHSSAT